MHNQLQSNKIVVPIFVAMIIVTFLIYTPIVFPALFSSIAGNFTDSIKNPYEFGHQAGILIISNILILGFGFAYYKKKIPNQLLNAIEKIRSFEISKKHTLIIFSLIMGIYIGFTTPEIFLDESEQADDFIILMKGLAIWPSGESDNPYVKEQNDRYVRMFLLDTSLDVFQNIKLLPFIASILVVAFTYLITTQICQKRFAGIISMIILLQSCLLYTSDAADE